MASSLSPGRRHQLNLWAFGLFSSFWAQLARKHPVQVNALQEGLFPSIPDVIAKIPKTRPFQGRAPKEVRVVGKAPWGYSHPHPCVTSGKLLLGKQDRPVDELYCVHIGEEMQVRT